jgi:hypothetical protein
MYAFLGLDLNHFANCFGKNFQYFYIPKMGNEYIKKNLKINKTLIIIVGPLKFP